MKKKILGFMLSFGMVAGVMAQGTVIFDNLTTGNPATDPKIFNTDGVTGLDSSFVAQLWGGADAGSLAPLGATLSFFDGAGAGFLNGGASPTRNVPGITAGNTATFVVQTWSPADGATYAEAVAKAGAITGVSLSFTQTLGGPDPGGGPNILPQKLTNLQSFSSVMTPVPEPSVIMLGLAGAGLLWFRRKK